MTKYIRSCFLIIRLIGSAQGRLNISKWASRVFVSAGLVFLTALVLILVDYAELKQASLDQRKLKETVLQQKDAIRSKQNQIELLAAKVDVLQSNIVGLQKLERKVKVMAKFKDSKTLKGERFASIGGSTDLDPAPEISPDRLAREVNDQVETLYLASINQKQSLEGLLNSLKSRENLLACMPSVRPCKGWISSAFGSRTSPFSGYREFHKGLDIANDQGTEIYSTADGVVTFAGPKDSFGNMVVLDHGYGMITKYAHVSKILVKKGEYVNRKDAVALMGDSGRSTGPHLHYEVLLNGIHVNPLNYIN